MVLEVAVFKIVPGQEAAFAAAYAEAREALAATPGFHSARMTRGIESPSTFVLLVEWDTLEAHLETFRGSERYQTWRALISPYFDGAPTVEHYQDLAE